MWLDPDGAWRLLHGAVSRPRGSMEPGMEGGGPPETADRLVQRPRLSRHPAGPQDWFLHDCIAFGFYLSQRPSLSSNRSRYPSAKILSGIDQLKEV
jgi:hypothetical protein